MERLSSDKGFPVVGLKVRLDKLKYNRLLKPEIVLDNKRHLSLSCSNYVILALRTRSIFICVFASIFS